MEFRGSFSKLIHTIAEGDSFAECPVGQAASLAGGFPVENSLQPSVKFAERQETSTSNALLRGTDPHLLSVDIFLVKGFLAHGLPQDFHLVKSFERRTSDSDHCLCWDARAIRTFINVCVRWCCGTKEAKDSCQCACTVRTSSQISHFRKYICMLDIVGSKIALSTCPCWSQAPV